MNIIDEQEKGLDEYLTEICNLLIKKMKSEEPKIFKTNQGDFEIKKILEPRSYNLNFGKKIHNLFSPEGCIISGSIQVETYVYTSKDKDAYTNRSFGVNFKPIKIKFDYDKELFFTEEPLEILYIIKSQNFPFF